MSPSVANTREFTLPTQGFQGGLNIRDAVDQLQPNELSRAENVVYDSAGGVGKRLGERGMGPIGSGGDRIISSYTYYRPGSNPQVLAHTTAGIMYYTNDATANPITWTSLKTGLSTTVPAAFETENSKVYFAEGTLLGQWDGTTYTTIGAAPAGIYYLRVWKDTMWAWSTANPDRIYSSAAGDPTSWPGANFVDVMHGDGDQVSALATDGLFLIVAKKRRIQVIYDPALFSNRTADLEKGAESHFAWEHHEDKLFFLSRLGIVWWQGDTSGRIVSYKIDSLFNPSVLNLNALGSAYSYHIGSRCGWALPEVGHTSPTLIIEYYPRLGPIYQISGNIGPGPWTMHRMAATAFTTVRQGTVEALYGGSTGANKLLWLFSPDGTDDGAVINSVVTMAPNDFSSPIYVKYLRRARIVGRGKFNFQLKREYQNAVYSTDVVDMSSTQRTWGSSNWNSDDWGPDATIKSQVVDLDAYGKAIAIQITDSEIKLGTQPLSAGSLDYPLTLGEWAIFQVTFDGQVLGLRG